MKIPDDVKIVVAYNLGGYPPESIEARVRNAGEYPSEVWYSDDQFKVMNESGIVILGSGHFARTVKTRRVVWDLPDGITIEPELKAKMEACVLKSNQHPDDMREVVGEWWYCVGKTKSFHHSKCGLLLLVSIVESTEEVPWSPFEVEK